MKRMNSSSYYPHCILVLIKFTNYFIIKYTFKVNFVNLRTFYVEKNPSVSFNDLLQLVSAILRDKVAILGIVSSLRTDDKPPFYRLFSASPVYIHDNKITFLKGFHALARSFSITRVRIGHLALSIACGVHSKNSAKCQHAYTCFRGWNQSFSLAAFSTALHRP